MNTNALVQMIMSGGKAVAQGLSDNYLYDPKTQRPFPSSPLYYTDKDFKDPNKMMGLVMGMTAPINTMPFSRIREGAATYDAAGNIASRFFTKPASQLVSHEGAPDTKRIMEYVNKIARGEPIEPLKIIREGAKYGIEDGKHRYAAFQRLGISDIPTELVRGR